MPTSLSFPIIWGVLAFAQLLYVVVPIPIQQGDPGFLSTLALALGVVAFAEGLGVVALLHLRALRPIAQGGLDPRTREGQGQLFVSLILCWVLAESIAVYGLVLRVLGASSDLWSPFAMLGGLLLLICRPWQRGLQPARDARSQGLRHDPIE